MEDVFGWVEVYDEIIDWIVCVVELVKDWVVVVGEEFSLELYVGVECYSKDDWNVVDVYEFYWIFVVDSNMVVVEGYFDVYVF